MNYVKRYWLIVPYIAIVLFPTLYLAITQPAELWFDWRYNAAQLLAFTGASLLMMQLVLATRWAWLDHVVGFDKLTKVHKWAGITGLSCILLHALGISWYYFSFGWDTLIAFIWPGWRWETLGMVSLDLMVAVVIITICYRRWHIPYHWWKRIHLLMYLGILGGVLHSLYLGSHLVAGLLRWYWLGLAGLATLSLLHRRVIVPFMAKGYTVQTHEVIASTVHHVTLVPTNGSVFNYQPGQFAFVQFQAAGISKEWHPFTISSQPNSTALTFSMKESGDWTKTLNHLTAGTPAKIEGPYGQFSYKRLPTDDLGYVFVAGGIGITPLHSMITALLAEGSRRQITLLYSAKAENEFAFQAEFDQLASTHPNFKAVYTTKRLDRNVYETNIPKLLQQHYFICGPKPMMAGMRKLLAELGVPVNQIHFEEFALN